jgi:acetylornithine aminotransferase
LDNAVRIGHQVREGLRAGLEDLPQVRDIRGKGLMVGVDLDRPCGDLVKLALEHGLLINVTADNVVRLLPPLIMQPDEAQSLVDGLRTLIREFVSEPASVAA